MTLVIYKSWNTKVVILRITKFMLLECIPYIWRVAFIVSSYTIILFHLFIDTIRALIYYIFESIFTLVTVWLLL